MLVHGRVSPRALTQAGLTIATAVIMGQGGMDALPGFRACDYSKVIPILFWGLSFWKSAWRLTDSLGPWPETHTGPENPLTGLVTVSAHFLPAVAIYTQRHEFHSCRESDPESLRNQRFFSLSRAEDLRSGCGNNRGERADLAEGLGEVLLCYLYP